ncbi:MAG: hypothetical protein K2L28_03065, partial [Muribaculaceae bacterium]|nr:hypothetical protein [Muribaculaceae bacterium]
FAFEDGLKYVLWKDDDYINLRNRPPFISIAFVMYKVGTLSDSEGYAIPARCGAGWSGQRGQAEKGELAEVTQMAYGLLLPAIADKVTSKGYFYQPFFVRYAYRMYDGTYSWHSAPILMLPTILPPFIQYSDDGSHPAAGETLNATFTLNVPYFGLAYRILTDGIDELSNWSDLVAGIDIFVSAPIYTYDQSKDLPWRPVVTTRTILSEVSPDKEMSTSGRPTAVVAGEVFVGHYADSLTGSYVDHTMKTGNIDNPDYYSVLNIKPHEKMHRNIQSAHEFYKLAEIDIKDIKVMSEMAHLKITDSDLSSLVTRQTLDDDYQSHCNLVASSLYAFNSRLNLSGVKIAPAVPFPMRSCMQYGNPEGLTTTRVRITVWTRLNGVRCYSVHTGEESVEADIWHNPSSNFPRYLYYPDASAYKMEIFVTESQKYIINLTPHDFLNGAYYYMGKSGMSKVTTPTNAEPETAQCAPSVSVGSKIYTSEINNPFTFPLLGINTIGSGDIYGICSAAKALSQGQFGQFPLYAFTSEGVWALETTPTGTYSAKQPITRDVCINAASITQIDSSVLFATDRGIMLISGSQTQCITDVVNSDSPFDVLTLPGMDKLHSMLGHDDKTCFPVAPFSEFIKTCGMIYDYVHQHIIVFSPEYSYSYVYSLKSHLWGMLFSNIDSVVNSYPEALAVDKDSNLVDFTKGGAGEISGLLVTRPLKLDAADVLKTVDTIIQRGNFRKGHVQSVVYGSRDLYNWSLVWSSKDHFLRGFRGTPYKYFRIALLCNLAEDESIYGATVQYDTRKTNQPR